MRKKKFQRIACHVVNEAVADMLDSLKMFSERISEMFSERISNLETAALAAEDPKQVQFQLKHLSSRLDGVDNLTHNELRPVLGGHSVDLARFREELDFINVNIKNIVDSVRTASNDISNQNSTLSHIHDTLNAAYERDQVAQGHIQGINHRVGRLENDLDSLSKTLFGKLELIVRNIVGEEVDSAKKADHTPTPHTRARKKFPTEI